MQNTKAISIFDDRNINTYYMILNKKANTFFTKPYSFSLIYLFYKKRRQQILIKQLYIFNNIFLFIP